MESLTAPLTVGTKVVDLSTEGGTAPYTYSLKASTQDNDGFQINGTEVQVKTQIDEEATKNITVTVTDSKGKTKEATAQINVASAGV